MAGGAADARVVTEEALTVRDPVGLETNVGGSELARADDLLPRAVALAAKGGHVFGVHPAEFLRRSSLFSLREGVLVGGGALVAVFAIQTGTDGVEPEFSIL